MKYYPVNLNINNRKCLVVGGGAVAFRKVKMLIECGAQVEVVGKEFCLDFQEFKDSPAVILCKREYLFSDLEGKFLVIGATNNETLNRQISSDAQKLSKLCNIADVPEICNFILPSVIRRGDLVIAVSTSGKSPAFAKKLRKDLEKTFGDEYARFLELMGEIRKELLSKEHAHEAHKPIFEKLIHGGLLEMIKDNRKPDINRLLKEILGEESDYDHLVESIHQSGL